MRVVEDAGERVVVVLRNRIVLVIVAAGATHGQSQEAASDHVDSIVTLIGARDFDRAVVVIPGTQPEESCRGQRLVPSPAMAAAIVLSIIGSTSSDHLR